MTFLVTSSLSHILYIIEDAIFLLSLLVTLLSEWHDKPTVLLFGTGTLVLLGTVTNQMRLCDQSKNKIKFYTVAGTVSNAL